ncbi:hypothetical protein [Enorma phocaeensis]|uniref:hypothetical protein n=1 Tax=Enorma phocaeensis TaxID=1871019 RepID=UPI003209C1FD
MSDQTDISLAFELEDITLLECVYHAEAPIQGRELDRRLLVQNPGKRFSLDVKRRKNVLRANVSVQFGLFDRKEKVNIPDAGLQPLEVVHFGLVAGVVVTAPIMGGEAIAPRHLAGDKTPEAHRDEKMERGMRVEAIKAAYGLATSKLLELSAMSPIGSIMLPLIDTDEIFDDIVRNETEV